MNQKRERTVMIGLFLLSIVLTSLVVPKAFERAKHRNIAVPDPQLLSVDSSKAIGPHKQFLGDPEAPYTLVEFGDYECPPCIGMQPEIKNVREKYKGKMRFVFRQMPLSMHKQAMPAAIVAETARLHGKFFEAHDFLYASNIELNGLNTEKVGSKLGLDLLSPPSSEMMIAKNSIAKDVSDAKDLGVEGTPSFLLCGPGNTVHRLNDLSQVSRLIDRS